MKLWNKTMRRRRDKIVMWYTDISTTLQKTIGVRQSTVFYTREGVKISGCVWTGPKTVLWGPIHMYQFLFENGYFFSPGLTYRPHVCLENGHRKRIFSKTLSIVDIFEKAGFSFTRGRTKTEVIEYDDVIHHILLVWRMFRSYLHCFSVFVWTDENASTTLRVDAYFVENREKKSGYMWTGPKWLLAVPWSLTLNCWNLFWLLARMVQYIA